MVKKIFWLALMFLMLGFVIKKCIPYTYLGYEESAQSQSLLIIGGFIIVKLTEIANNFSKELIEYFIIYENI